ncbi:MAG: hypothetical protein IJW67_08725, partial [Blautia sp.]|nr:hypothetical protein [Blautia sp.]
PNRIQKTHMMISRRDEIHLSGFFARAAGTKNDGCSGKIKNVTKFLNKCFKMLAFQKRMC